MRTPFSEACKGPLFVPFRIFTTRIDYHTRIYPQTCALAVTEAGQGEWQLAVYLTPHLDSLLLFQLGEEYVEGCLSMYDKIHYKLKKKKN